MSPINKLFYICFDLETYGLDPDWAEVIQVAGQAYDPRTLEPIPEEEGGRFESMMKPLYPERLQDERAKKALAVNKKRPEEILGSPDQKQVWSSFVAWVNKFANTKTARGAPIAVGKNIRNFDMAFVERLNKLHCPKKEKTVLFNDRHMLDLEDIIFLWFENEAEPARRGMDALREFFGMEPTGKAHDALVDVIEEGALAMHFLSLTRELQKRRTAKGEKFIKFEGAFKGKTLVHL